MAYRFLYEVPGSLLNDANVVVNAVPDAQVVVVRDGHGRGIDNDSKDLTVAAHSLRVLDAIYAWHDDLEKRQPLARHPFYIALHSGERLGIHELAKSQMVAAIRRDQPWVERTMPKIGVHDTRVDPSTAVIETLDVPVVEEAPDTTLVIGQPSAVATATDTIQVLAIDGRDRPQMTVAGVRHIVLPVIDLAKPERTYRDIFGADIVARGEEDERGGLDLLPPAQDSEVEAQLNTEPSWAFLRNGDLHLALERQGRGLPLKQYGDLADPIRLTVSRSSMNRIRAKVLMQGWNVLASEPNLFVFRDPYAINWAIIGDEGTSNSHA